MLTGIGSASQKKRSQTKSGPGASSGPEKFQVREVKSGKVLIKAATIGDVKCSRGFREES